MTAVDGGQLASWGCWRSSWGCWRYWSRPRRRRRRARSSPRIWPRPWRPGDGRDVILQADRATVEAVAARHGLAMVKWLKTGAVLRASGAQLQALAADPGVGHLSGDTLVRSMMAVADQAIGADQAWAGSLPGVGSVTGRGIGVALVDSGNSNTGRWRAGSWRAWTSPGPTAPGEDELGHGTHIAGIVAGNSAGFKGVAPGANLVSLKVLGADGSGGPATSSAPSTTRSPTRSSSACG